MTTPGPFFIGGTGRSGTTRLATVLGQHPAVYALPDETRFLIDPGGLEDLAHALTGAYTPFHGDDALRRFDRLMRVTLCGHSQTEFRGWDLPSMVGAPRYWAALDRLWEQLVWYAFDVGIPTDGQMPPRSRYEPTTYRRVVPRYFDDRPTDAHRHPAQLRRRAVCRCGRCERQADLVREDTPQHAVGALPVGALP